jgi:hypothetical protein
MPAMKTWGGGCSLTLNLDRRWRWSDSRSGRYTPWQRAPRLGGPQIRSGRCGDISCHFRYSNNFALQSDCTVNGPSFTRTMAASAEWNVEWVDYEELHFV